jgi:adenylate cyclase
MKLIHSLRVKLTLSFLFLVMVIAGMAMIYVLKEASQALKDVARDEIETVASVVSTQIDGDKIISLKPGSEKTAEYKAIKGQLNKIQFAGQDIQYIYAMKRVGKQVQFLVDSQYGSPKNIGAAISDNNKDVTRAMLEGFAVASSDIKTTPNKSGYLITGYAPIKDSQGRYVALVGVDVSDSRLIIRQKLVGNMVYLILGLVAVLAGLIVLLISATIIEDINKLNCAAEKISKGDMSVTVNIKRKDEIGQLADSFSRMIASLKIMMMGDK